MDHRKRFSDPLATTEKQTVSFLNERQGTVRYQDRNNDRFEPSFQIQGTHPMQDNDRSPRVVQQDSGEDVPDGALSTLPKKSNLKQESSIGTKKKKGAKGEESFEEREVKFKEEPQLNNAKILVTSPSRDLYYHNNLTLDDSSEEFSFRRDHYRKNSNLSASAMSLKSNRSSVMSADSDFDDELKLTTHLTVLKIIFVDIFFSLGDHITDFLQGFNLMFGDLLDVSMAAWSLEFLNKHWDQRGQYGLIVLLLNWSPGIIAVVHMLAYHRLSNTNIEILNLNIFNLCLVDWEL